MVFLFIFFNLSYVIFLLFLQGDLIHQVSQSASYSYLHAYLDSPSPPSISTPSSSGEEYGNAVLDTLEPHPLRVAAKAYSLSSVLMLILMHGRVLNEEPLVLRGAEIAATGKLADPQSLLCYHGNNSPGLFVHLVSQVGIFHYKLQKVGHYKL